MSCFTTVKTQIKDEECLKQALNDLGFNYFYEDWQIFASDRDKEKGKVFQTKKLLTIRPYDIPVTFEKKENFYHMDIATNHGGIGFSQKEAYKILNQISQAYAIKKIEKELKRKGYKIKKKELQEDQSIKLEVSLPIF